MRHPMRPYTDELRLELVKAYQAGATIREVAERYKCARSMVERAMRESGVKSRKATGRADRMPQEERDKICAAYRDGKSQYWLAKNLGIDYAIIGQVLEQAGIKREVRPMMARETQYKIREPSLKADLIRIRGTNIITLKESDDDTEETLD